MADDRFPHLWIPVERARRSPVGQGGGGTKFTREDVADHSRQLKDRFDRALEHIQAKEDIDVARDLIVEITTAAEWPASREKQHLQNLGFEILAFVPDAKNVVIARIPQAEVPRFQNRLTRYADSAKHIGKGNFGAIENVQPVGTARKIEPRLAERPIDVDEDCLITIYAALPEELKSRVAERLVTYLLERGKDDTAVHRFINGTVGVSARLSRLEMDQVSEQFMLVRSIESNAEIVIESSVQADPVPTIIQVEPIKCRTPVAVIDSGVSTTSPLMVGIVLRIIDELPPGTVGPHMSHGTFVASRVVYGDDITGVLSRRATPWCPIVDIQVTGDDGIGNRVTQKAARLGEILQRVVPQLAGDVKVYNLSLGLSPISDGRYSEVARLIDYLSREYGVLFVIAAGNIDAPQSAPPGHFLHNDARILSPAEALLAITVGSIAKYEEVHCVARGREVSPFSRRGPGADSGLKPEVAAHGGNVFFTGIGWTSSPRMAVYGLGRAGTHLEYATGTSYAAPLVAQYAARLFDAYPNASANLVRALLCHFADSVLCPEPGNPLERHHFCGFGEPAIDSALYSQSAAAAMLFQGQLDPDNYLHIPFHVPAALAGDRRSRLVVRGTVVFDPPVNPDDSVNYSQSRVTGLLRKRSGGSLRDVQIGGADDDVRHPWNPLLHFQHPFRHGYETGEWELRLRLMTRGELPQDFVQNVAVVLEIVDARGHVDVRNSVLSEYPGIYVPVRLRIAA